MQIRRGSRKGELSAKVKPEVAARLADLGRERALIYKTLTLTGLRKSELASIAISHVDLDGQMACLILDAANEKNGHGSDIPLRADLAADLREWIEDKQAKFCGPDEVFRQKPLFVIPEGINRIIDRDFAAAGIPKRDERGRVVDLHALRTTFGTMLSKGGVMPRTAQAAMRHSDISLTMSVYTDPKLLDIHGAMNALPELPLNSSTSGKSSVHEATGTTGADSICPPLFPPGAVLTGHSGALPVLFEPAIAHTDVDGLVDETSLKPTKKGSRAGVAKEPSEIAPLGFEPRLIESESIVDESQRNENGRFQGLTGDSSAPVSPKPWKDVLESAVAVPWKRDFSSMIAAIMSLPLTDDEKAEVVRRLLARGDT